jgi:hypothetical protein
VQAENDSQARKLMTTLPITYRPVRLAYQPPVSSTFLSEQTSHQQSANSTFLSEQTSTSHQPPAKRTGCIFPLPYICIEKTSRAGACEPVAEYHDAVHRPRITMYAVLKKIPHSLRDSRSFHVITKFKPLKFMMI